MEPRRQPSRPSRGAATPVDGPLLAQGAYYAATGIWPLLHMRSFEAVTGPKREHWLVHTVGVLALGIGTGLATAALRRRVTPEIRLLAALAAAGFIAVEVPNVARRRISPVYALDAAVEAVFLVSASGPRDRKSVNGRTRKLIRR